MGGLLLAPSAVLMPAVLRVRGGVAHLVAGIVCASAVLVASATALSAFDAFTTYGMLAAEALAALAAAALWVLRGRPQLPRPRLPARAALVQAAREHPAVAVLAALVGPAVIVQAWQGMAVVSNDWDPVAYHLSRAAYWIQEQSVTQFPGGTPRQLGYPPNAEILQGWTMLIWGGDRLVSLVQLAALLGAGCAIYLGARELRFGRAGAAFAGLLFVSLPLPLMQATTGQNDDIAAFFVAAAAVLGVRGLRDRHLGELTLAAMALGLALGTKGIVLVTGPSLLLLFAVVVWKRRVERRVVVIGLGMALAAFAVLGAYNFALNLRNTGDLYGGARDGTQRSSSILSNALKVNWEYVDLPGVTLPWADPALQQLLPQFLLDEQDERFSFRVDSSPNTSQSGFGPVGLFFLLPLILAYLVWPRAGPDRRLAAGAAALFVLLFPLAAESDPDLLRLATVGLVLGAPLLAALAARPGLAAVATAAAVLVMIPSVLWNPLRPVIVPPGATPAYKQTRNAQYSYGRAEMAEVLERMDGLVSPTARIGFAGPGDAWDYPFFGPRLDRHVTRLQDTAQLDLDYMRDHRLDAVVVERLPAPADLRNVRLGPSFTLVLPGAG